MTPSQGFYFTVSQAIEYYTVSKAIFNKKTVELTLENDFVVGNLVDVDLEFDAVRDNLGNKNKKTTIPKVSKKFVQAISIEYKPYDNAHKDKFSIGDYNSKTLFGIRGASGMVNSLPEYTVNIKNGDTVVYTKAKAKKATEAPINGAFDLHLDMPYSTWKGIADNTDLTIEFTIEYRNAWFTEPRQQTKIFTVTKTSDGNIYTWRGLQNMKENLTGTYTLQDDIVFPTPGTKGFSKTGFVPIGNNVHAFSGLLKGNNKTITGLYIRHPNHPHKYLNYVGLFGYITKTSNTAIAVQNLTMHNTNIEGNQYVGSIAGYVDNTQLKQVASTADTTTIAVKGNSEVGGLVGYSTKSSIYGYTTINIIGSIISGNPNPVHIGGLVGQADVTNIIQGYSTSNIDAPQGGGIGGLVGWVNPTGSVLSIVQGYSTGDITGKSQLGGLVGDVSYSGKNGPISKVQGYSTGDITGKSTEPTEPTKHVGGLVGYSDSVTIQGYSTGNIFANGNAAGGLVGYGDGVTIQGYSLGYVSTESLNASDISSGVGSLKTNSTSTNTIHIYTGYTSTEADLETGTGTGTGAGTGDHVGIISTTTPTSVKTTTIAPIRWIIEDSGSTITANTNSKFYSRNKESFRKITTSGTTTTSYALPFTEVTSNKPLTDTDNLWKFHIDGSNTWPIFNVPAKIANTEFNFNATQNPSIPSKPTNFKE